MQRGRAVPLAEQLAAPASFLSRKRRVSGSGKTGLLSVTHFGPFPPPYGGVSVFIRRLHNRLLRDGYESRVAMYRNGEESGDGRVFRRPGLPWPAGRLDGWYYRWAHVPGAVQHWHDSWHGNAHCICSQLRAGKRAVITVHNEIEAGMHQRCGPAARRYVKEIIRCRKVIWVAVSHRIREGLMKEGVEPDRIRVYPAYLPEPQPVGEPALPSGLLRFFESHGPIIAVYGWRFSSHKGGDLYGFDESLILAASLKTAYPKIGLVILCPGGREDEHSRREGLEALGRELGLEGHVFWALEPVDHMVALWTRCDAYVRPSLTDGDAVSVRECLSLGVPVVASDAVERPAQTMIYPVGDRARLRETAEAAIKRGRSEPAVMPDVYGGMVSIYSALQSGD